MSIPGGPREPNRNDLRAKLQQCSAERTKCFERLNAIRDLFQDRADDSERDDSRREVNELRSRVRAIESQRAKERSERAQKDQEMRALRQSRRDMDRKLQEMSRELGCFRSLEDIEAAIDLVNMKMETGSGDLKFEKISLKRLGMLEEAKSLVLQLQPTEDAIKEAEEREEALQAEYKEIYARIDLLDKEHAGAMGLKTDKEKQVAKASQKDDRSHLIKEREEIRAKITKINETADSAKTTFDQQMKAWNDWKEVAMQKYRDQQEAQRRERERIWAERDAARKAAKKAAKLERRRNPFEGEIDACSTLIAYLHDKVAAHDRERQERERMRKLAAFDPASSAPAGLKLPVRDDEWLFQDRTKKVQKAAPAAAKPAKEAVAPPPPKEKVMHHSTEKHRLFERIKVEAPVSFGQVDAAVKALKAKKAEFETHILHSIEDVSTDEEVDDDGVAPSEAPTASEAPAPEAPAAAVASE